MSWHYLRGAEEVCSQAIYWDGEQCAPSSATRIADEFYSQDRETGFCQGFQFGTMLEHSTQSRGGARSTLLPAASRAKDSAQQLEVKLRRRTCGRKCSEWWLDQNQISFLPKMFLSERLRLQPTTSSIWVSFPRRSKFPRQTWVQTTCGPDIGFLHTPTCTANYSSPSMQKWPSCRAFVRAFGKPTPTNHEWLMGWPIGWTDLKPLETDRFQSWLLQHISS
jgi:hypothetical protein